MFHYETYTQGRLILEKSEYTSCTTPFLTYDQRNFIMRKARYIPHVKIFKPNHVWSSMYMKNNGRIVQTVYTMIKKFKVVIFQPIYTFWQ